MTVYFVDSLSIRLQLMVIFFSVGLLWIRSSKVWEDIFPREEGLLSIVDRVGVQMRDWNWLSKPNTLTS